MTSLKPILQTFLFLLCTTTVCTAQNLYDTLRTVKMTAVADHQTNQLRIQWEDDPGVNTYRLYKKLRQDTSWGAPLLTSGDQDTAYLDTEVEEGVLYEYRVVKQTGDTLGYGYLFSGLDYLPPPRRGDILLLIEAIAADSVEEELRAYTDVLVSEGWLPRLVSVAEDASVQEVKTLILQYYAELDSLTTVLLIGNIAVPHSGDINPDGHRNHKGAWPADLYYGDVDGSWTDQTVFDTSSAYPRLHNVPGDGNFDQDYIPSEIELAVGRLDFSELPVYTLDQYQLLARYLQKNMDFRTGKYRVKRRAVFKNVNPWKEGLGQNAIRNFVPLVSPDSLVYGDYFDAFYDSFLWSYGGSSGSMINSNGLGSIYTYADNNFQAVFTSFFGSYFGDYDYENNYLRTILASGKVLSTAWVGAPNWFFHPMGLGLDLGFCTLLTQNNSEVYYGGYFPQSVTINLLGDPTLKAYIVPPPADLQASQTGNHIRLSWSPGGDDIQGYQVYKRPTDEDYFEAINLLPVTDTSLVDSCVQGDMQWQYLVRAVKREITPSGSFINHSSGPLLSLLTAPNILPSADFTLNWEQGTLLGRNLSANAGHYEWILPDGSSVFEEHFEIPYNQSGEITVTLIASNSCFSDTLQQSLFITGLKDPETGQKIRVYPNPARTSFTLETDFNLDELQLYDLLGVRIRSVYDLKAGTHTFDLRDLPAGTYLLKIRAGSRVFSKVIQLGIK